MQNGSAKSVICVKEVVGGSRCWEVDRVEKGGRGTITQKLYIRKHKSIKIINLMTYGKNGCWVEI